MSYGVQSGSPRDQYVVARPSFSLHFDLDPGAGRMQSRWPGIVARATARSHGRVRFTRRSAAWSIPEACAKARRLAVISREQSSAYRVRGYLAVKVTKHQTTVSWVWDVFDQDEHRALRISGEETAKVRPRDAWAAADDAMLNRIARSSMEQLATFLTSPAVAPGISPPTSDLQVAMAEPQESSPEAAGIFRLFHPLADPEQTVAAEAATDDAEPVPLPPRRPRTAAVSAREALTLAAGR